MARPPSGIDLKLKAAGIELLREAGITGLAVREVCRRAGVNTGMFHYHFGSKEEFLREVLREMYAEFMLSFKAGVSAGGTPRQRLKNALVEVGRFALGMRKTAPMLFADMAHGKKEAFAFASANLTEHIHHISVLAEECRPASAVKERSLPFMIAALIPVMIFPVLVGGMMERNGVQALGGVALDDLKAELFSDKGVAARAEIALRGIGL